jgi:hypothetical protein
MNPKLLATCACTLALGVGIGCETPVTKVDTDFGNAARSNAETMIASTHEADGTPREPIGLDGETAAGVVRNYHHNEEALNQAERKNRSGLIQLDGRL